MKEQQSVRFSHFKYLLKLLWWIYYYVKLKFQVQKKIAILFHFFFKIHVIRFGNYSYIQNIPGHPLILATIITINKNVQT